MRVYCRLGLKLLQNDMKLTKESKLDIIEVNSSSDTFDHTEHRNTLRIT